MFLIRCIPSGVSFPRSISFNTLYVSGLLRALFFVMNGNSSTACCKSSVVTERTVLSLPKISCKIWIFLLTRFLESADLFLREFWLLYTSANASNVISGFNGVLNNIGEETIFSPVSVPKGRPQLSFADQTTESSRYIQYRIIRCPTIIKAHRYLRNSKGVY